MIRINFTDQNMLDLRWVESSLDLSPCLVQHANWKTGLTFYDGPGKVLYRSSWEGGDSVVLEFGPSVYVNLSLRGGRTQISVAADNPETIAETLEVLRGVIPVVDTTGERRPVCFWSDHVRGPRCITRLLDVPKWEEIAFNYPARNARRLAELTVFEPTSAGQLILWRGKPGTGKTWMLRSLVREWEWATFHYITDPDKFFGENASYMLDVILSDEDDDEDEIGKWKILVLEDAGELLAKDARERTGQGLSRLLNLVDGLIGQGLRVLVLVTTNEELGKMHPAITRPGRCAFNIEFGEMWNGDVERWAERQGLDHFVSPRPNPTIAELFAAVAGVEIEEGTAVGFSA